MAKKLGTKTCQKVLGVFEESKKPLSASDVVSFLGEDAPSERTVQDYIGALVSAGLLDRLLSENGSYTKVEDPVPFKSHVYAVPGTVREPGSGSMVVDAYLRRAEKALERNTGLLSAHFDRAWPTIERLLIGALDSAAAFAEERPLVAGFIMGAVAVFVPLVFVL